MGTPQSDEALDRLIDLGHLASGVGHHVINAFSAIVSSAELLRVDPPLPASVADPAALADSIIRTAVEAATVARRLIDYTRPVTSIEPDRAAFQPDTLSLDAIAGEAVAAASAATGPHVVWQTELAALPQIKGHAKQLRTMFAYLLRNSLEALPPSGGTVTVVTTSDDRGWNVVEVRDTGLGMEPSTLERAVESFFSTKPGHLGVGLSIANGIWRRHRGTLSVQSRPGEGTRLRLCVEPSPESA